MSNLYFSFGSILLVAFVFVNLLWVLVSNDALPPGMAWNEEMPQETDATLREREQGAPIFGATLRTPEMTKPAVQSAR